MPSLNGQVPRGGFPNNQDPNDPFGNTNPEDTLFQGQEGWQEIKHVDLTYTLMGLPTITYLETRDTLNDAFRKYDPADRANPLHFNLANIGSAARPVAFDPLLPKGIFHGASGYDLYMVDPDSLRFYDPEIPLTSIFASQGSSQDDGMIHARFGRRFADGISMSANYFRINQTGLYAAQRTKNTNVSFGIHQKIPGSNLESYYAYLSNSVVAQQSGGIQNYEDLALRENQNRLAVDVHLVDALTTIRDRHFLMQHYYHVKTKSDTSNESKNLFDLHYKFHWNPNSFKFFDASFNNQNPEYYGSFLAGDRGVRNFISYRKLMNEFGFTGYVNEKNLLKASIEHRLIYLNQEPIEENRNEIFINGELQTTILDRFSLVANGYLGLLDASANFRLQGRAGISLEKIGKLSGQLLIFQRRPFLLEETAFINQTEIYGADFKNVNVNLIGVDYHNENWKLSGDIHWWVVDNFIYFDELFQPQQIENAISIRQIRLQKDFSIGPLILTNQVTFQNFDEARLRLPSLILQHSLSLNGRIFKKALRYQIGVDFTYTDDHSGVAYFPLTSQYGLSDQRMVMGYPALDAFAAFKIKSFKVFLKSENVNAFFSDDVYDQIIGHPQFESYFRLGFSFQLFN